MSVAWRHQFGVDGRHDLPDVVVLVTNVSVGIIGGIIQYLDPLKRDLPRYGIQVVSLQFPRAFNLLESRGLPRIVRAMLHLGFVAFCVARILRLHSSHRRVLVHSHGASYALLTSALAKALGQHAVHTFHSPIQKRSRVLKWFAPRLDALVFVSMSLHELLRTLSDVRGREIHYFPGAVDLQGFRPVGIIEKSRLRAEILAESGLPNRGVLSLFMGRITPEKGVLELVEAAVHLKNLRTPTSILVVGPVVDSAPNRAYFQKIEQRVRDAQLGDWIRLKGPVTQPYKERLMAAADIFVCSSLWEASGLSVVEAFASGVPVVASRAGGLQERVRHGETGLLVEPGDPADLARAIDELARSEALRSRMGILARVEAESLYGEARLVEDHVKLYDQILSHDRHIT